MVFTLLLRRLWHGPPVHAARATAGLYAAPGPVLPLPCQHDRHLSRVGGGGQALAHAGTEVKEGTIDVVAYWNWSHPPGHRANRLVPLT